MGKRWKELLQVWISMAEVLIPANIRERFNINPGEKVTLEIADDQLKIINGDLYSSRMKIVYYFYHGLGCSRTFLYG